MNNTIRFKPGCTPCPSRACWRRHKRAGKTCKSKRCCEQYRRQARLRMTTYRRARREELYK